MTAKDTAADRYGYHVDNCKALLRRLSEAAASDFGVSEGSATWQDVGSAEGFEAALQELSDRVFREGEYAPSNIAR